MSTTHEVDLGGVHVKGSWNTPHGPEPIAELAVYTKSGQARIVQLDERQLARLIEQAAVALQQLRTRRDRVDALHTDHCTAQTCCRRAS